MTDRLRNGTYLREPDGATAIYFSPYNFADAAFNFKHRNSSDEWQLVYDPVEESVLWKEVRLQPGESVLVSGGKVL